MSLVEKALKKLQESRDTSVGGVQSRRPRPPSSPDNAPIGSVHMNVARVNETAPAKPVRATHAKLVVVDRDALRAAGLLPPEHQERQLADQYRQIKRPLLAGALTKTEHGERSTRLVMVTSAMPGDGKTFTSINLSISMSREKDHSVLLIDADVAKPHISRLFGVDNEPGLLDALVDPSIDMESLILPTDVPNLSILPAGRRSETATELLASQRMEILVRALEQNDHARMVIIDSPPLLLTSESRVLAQWVAQIVVVVRAGKTLQHDLLDAVSHLPQGKPVGLVLNQAVSASPGYYYGYGDNPRSTAQAE